MPRASEIMPGPTNGPPLREEHLRTSCVECLALQTLDQATVDETDPLETIYRCRNGCEKPILIVGNPGVAPWEGRGYRLGDWVIRNPSDVLVQWEGVKSPSVALPASPHALD